jgi:hypothetical protein
MKRPNIKILNLMVQFADSNYNCSQIIMLLNLKQAGHDNIGLVRAMSGLGNGCGFLNETCGVLTGAASVLAYHGGKGSDNETESDKLLPMLQDLGDWFRQQTAGKYETTRCKDIVGDQVGKVTGKKICGGTAVSQLIP